MRRFFLGAPRRFVFLALLALGCLFLGPILPAEGQASEASSVDRREAVFDRSADAGRLVARFLRLELPNRSESADKAGDATILTSPEGRVMLIDAGATECGPQVEAALRSLGVERIDALVASHPHVDHIGGMARILRSFPVGILYMSRLVYPTGPYRELLTAAREGGVKIVYLEAGSNFSFGDSVEVEVFNPEPDIVYYAGYPDNSTQFVNDRSLVLRMAYGSSSMLFMGDLYMPGELELLDAYGAELRSDLVKMGHHGSDTSSSKSFIRLVSPKIAVAIHDGVASLQVYRNYRKAGAAAYITFLDGTVKASVDTSSNWTVLTQFDRQSDFLDN